MYFCRVHTLLLYARQRKKLSDFPVPIRDVTNQTLTLVSDIPAGDREIANLFLQCSCMSKVVPLPNR
jgi:hypothetical protein